MPCSTLQSDGRRQADPRPFWCFSVCDMLGGNMQAAEQFAAAVEMLHCYSLIHDDLPCMDNDDLRRGDLPAHKAFDEATAMLAGRCSFDEAFEAIANARQMPMSVYGPQLH